YRAIHPIFGTMDDFDRLLESAHRLGIKVILDLVPNHTSSQHPWFLESRASRNNPKRDWYIWRDPTLDGGPPNNWLSTFGGSAWEFDAGTSQYYYHAYLKQQPDLNWRNPDVRHAMHEVMRFWLDRGVDGFRVDVIWHLIKDEQFRANPPNPHYRAGQWPYRQLLAT
ncbi:MAG TPA: alpha-amylase family glycosyl hydrolase, partial [Nitrospira sp.]|nr:alpha-amylase family glycosyl hydrolase [Nitrospira sp.]